MDATQLQLHQLIPPNASVAAGSLVLTSPNPFVRVTYARCSVTTSAAVANRFLNVSIFEDDPEATSRPFVVQPDVEQVASDTVFFTLSENLPRLNHTLSTSLFDFEQLPLPRYICRQGARMQFSLANGQAGDVIENVLIQYVSGTAEELMMG